MKFRDECQVAIAAAQSAGELLREFFNKKVEILSSEGRDVKLQADRESEKLILKMLSESTDYPVLAEESGEHGAMNGGSPVWIIDPLDGSVNFSRGVGFCCVSIALWRGEEPILGVVYDFMRDELFTGTVGESASCNGKKISLSGVSEPGNAILSTGFPVNRDFESDSLKKFVENVQRFKKVRLFGTAALSLAYVACGRVDAYSEENIMLWDVAGGIAIVKAAGGRISNRVSAGKKWARTVDAACHDALLLH